MSFPPGLKYLITQVLPKALIPPVLVYSSCYVATEFGLVQLPLPLWFKTTIIVLSLPATLILKNLLRDLKQIQESRAMGAVRVPLVPSKLPGGIDMLRSGLLREKTAYLADIIRDLMKVYGQTFNMRVFFEDKIFTTEPEFIKSILATDFNNWEKGPVSKKMMQKLLGDGVFNTDGEMWKFHRSMARPFFSRDRISHFDLFGRHADQALAAMKQRLREGYAVDFQDLVGRFTLDSATEFLFGHCVNVLDSGLPYSPNEKDAPVKASEFRETDRATKFADAFARSQEVVARRNRFNSAWPLNEFWEDKTEPLLKTINSFIDPIIKDAVQKKHLGAKASTPGEKGIEEDDTFLSHLVQVTDNVHILRDEILNIMIAGRDTTAATLTFAVYCLAMYPDIMKKLRKEIIGTVGSERPPTPDDLREMKYMRAFINEVLRLYPAVPFNQRSTLKPTTIQNSSDPTAKPWYVPGNTRIIYSVFLMHRRKDLWGPDAEKFDPERFLDSRLQKYLTPRPFIFLPFNAGPRICLGQQFAYNETSFFLVRLLQKYSNVTLDVEAQPVDSRPPPNWRTEGEPDERKRFEMVYPKSHLTLYCLGGLWVRMTEAPANESL